METLDIAERDMDVPLSPLGFEQATAFGKWLGTCTAPPEVVIASPYRRAMQTADSRWKRRLSIFGYTATSASANASWRARLADQSRMWRPVSQGGGTTSAPGQVLPSPPWWRELGRRGSADALVRDSLAREHLDKRVLLVTHEVVIVIWRYLLDDLDEHGALSLARDRPLANCSLTTYVRGDDENLVIDRENWTVPLEVSAIAVTEDHDAPVAPR